MIGGFKGSGQLCTSTSQIFVHKSLQSELSEALVAKVQSLKIGRTDSADENVFMGPMYSRKAVEKFLRYQTMAHREAKADLLWGKHLDAKTDMCLVAPGVHLMTNFDPSSSYQSNVLFCPDISLSEYEKLDDGVPFIFTTDAPYGASF